jgi:hypothetical protein
MKTGSNKVKLPKVGSNGIVPVPVGARAQKSRLTLSSKFWEFSLSETVSAFLGKWQSGSLKWSCFPM